MDSPKPKKEFYSAEEANKEGNVVGRHVVDLSIDPRIKSVAQMVIRLWKPFQI